VPVPRAEVEAAEEAQGPFLAWGLRDEAAQRDLPLSFDQGVVRLVYPRLYGWKGCKWPCRLQFAVGDCSRCGFWEALGAHWRGRVDAEERFGDGDAQEGRQEAAASRSSSSSSSSIGSRWRRAWARWALWAVGVLFRWELTRPLALRLQRGIARWHNRPAASEARRKDL